MAKPVELQSYVLADFLLLLGAITLLDDARKARRNALLWECQEARLRKLSAAILRANLPLEGE